MTVAEETLRVVASKIYEYGLELYGEKIRPPVDVSGNINVYFIMHGRMCIE